MNITVHNGDIFQSPASCLINPANVQADLGWGTHICERVKKEAGASVQQERKSLGQLQLGEAGMTSAGDLPFDTIIHTAILDKYDFNPLFLLRIRQRTSDHTLEQAIRNTLELSLEKQIDSVALSAMGAGIGGMPFKKCTRIIFMTCRSYSADLEIHYHVIGEKKKAIADQVYKELAT